MPTSPGAASPSSAAENLRLLCGKLLFCQYPGCFELAKLLQLGDHVILGWSCSLLRRRRVGLLLRIPLLGWVALLRRIPLLLVGLLLPVGIGIRCILGLLVLFRPPVPLPPRYAVGHRGRRTGYNRSSSYSTNEYHGLSSLPSSTSCLCRLSLRLFSLQCVKHCLYFISRNSATRNKLRTCPPHGPDKRTSPGVLVEQQRHDLPRLDKFGGLSQIVIIQHSGFNTVEDGEVERAVVVEIGDRDCGESTVGLSRDSSKV